METWMYLCGMAWFIALGIPILIIIGMALGGRRR